MKSVRKEKGSSEMVTCLYLVMMICITLLAFYKIREIKVTVNYIEDGITLSGLAGALVDEDIATTQDLVMIDKIEGYEAFMEALKINLNLTENLNSKDNKYFSKIEVAEYVVYDKLSDRIVVTEYDENGSYSSKEMTSKVYAPNGSEITKTCIYIKLGIYMHGFLGTASTYEVMDKIVGVRY